MIRQCVAILDTVYAGDSAVDFRAADTYGAPMRWCLFAVFLTVGCGSSTPRYQAAPLPRSVRLTLHSVTIAMGKIDGTAWDGPGRIAPGQLQRLALALGGRNPYAQVLGILGEPINQALAKPEVMGRAMLFRSTGFDPPIQLSAQRDTFTPGFAGPPSWAGVPLDGSVRLSVDLTDNDAFFPDPMGSFQINAQDMVQALRAQHIVNVRVDGQTNRQILFANISVMPE